MSIEENNIRCRAIDGSDLIFAVIRYCLEAILFFFEMTVLAKDLIFDVFIRAKKTQKENQFLHILIANIHPSFHNRLINMFKDIDLD